jgi:predicted PurR-regulated permease PerM
MDDPKEIVFPFYARLALTLLAIMLILVLMFEGRSIIIPLFFSLLIAFMLLPLTKWFERRRLPRSLAAIVSILLFVSFLSGVFYFLGQQISEFSKDVPQLMTRAQAWIGDMQGWTTQHYRIDASRQIEYLNKATSGILSSFSAIAQAALLAVSGFAIWTIFVFIFSFFMLTHRALLRNFITCLFQRKDQPQVQEILTQTRLLANSYVVGLLIEMVIVAILNVGAFLIFGVKYAFLLGVLAAVLNIIPYLGIYTATAIAAVITLSNSSPNHALVVIVILIIIHFIDANFLMPRIVGSRVKMNPLITIVAVLVGHLLWGIPGMFLFIPLAGILKIIFERVDGLKPWAILMGTETEAKNTPPKS